MCVLFYGGDGSGGGCADGSSIVVVVAVAAAAAGGRHVIINECMQVWINLCINEYMNIWINLWINVLCMYVSMNEYQYEYTLIYVNMCTHKMYELMHRYIVNNIMYVCMD